MSEAADENLCGQMKIGIYQTQGAAGETGKNLESLRRAAACAAQEGAGLLICPEMFLTGYNVGESARALAEPRDGESARIIAGIARDAGIALLYGYPERAGELIYNAVQLIDRSGQHLANYRKLHLYRHMERGVFTPGDQFVQASVDDFRIGLLVCYDAEFPEAARAQALAGVELLAVPTALMRPHEFVALSMVPARAFENQLFVAYANRCGREGGLEYTGLSCVCGPDGADLARAGTGEEIIFAELDPSARERARRDFDYLADRRPELYPR